MDARDVSAYYNGHIPGACSLFDGEIFSNAKDLDRFVDVIIYGPGQATASKDPMDRLAGDAMARFKNLGFKNLFELDGGFEAWANPKNAIDITKVQSVKPVNMLTYDQLREFLS